MPARPVPPGRWVGALGAGRPQDALRESDRSAEVPVIHVMNATDARSRTRHSVAFAKATECTAAPRPPRQRFAYGDQNGGGNAPPVTSTSTCQ